MEDDVFSRWGARGGEHNVIVSLLLCVFIVSTVVCAIYHNRPPAPPVSPPAVAHPQQEKKNIIVLGDSTASLNDGDKHPPEHTPVPCTQERGTWPDRLYGAHIINLSCPGDTIGDTIATVARTTTITPQSTILISIGSNDARRGYPLTTIMERLSTLVDILPTKNIIFVHYLPITVPPACTHVTREAKNVSTYHTVANIAMEQVAKKHRLPLITMQDAHVTLCGENSNLIRNPTLVHNPYAAPWHTTPVGHEKIATIIDNQLDMMGVPMLH